MFWSKIREEELCERQKQLDIINEFCDKICKNKELVNLLVFIKENNCLDEIVINLKEREEPC